VKRLGFLLVLGIGVVTSMGVAYACASDEHEVCDGYETKCTDVQICDEYGENRECLHYSTERQCREVCTHWSCVPN
jgi:hypothetical protein